MAGENGNRPDLSKVKLVDPASYKQHQHETQPRREPDAYTDRLEPFGLEADVSEGERKAGSDRIHGVIYDRSDETLTRSWAITCEDEAGPACIEGTNISYLSVTGAGGRDSMLFESGHWITPPEGARANAIRDQLISDYGERQEEKAANPTPEGQAAARLSQSEAAQLEAAHAADRAAKDEHEIDL